MSWNYRIVKELPPTGGWSGLSRYRHRVPGDDDPVYSVREVYYSGPDDTTLSWTAGRGVPAVGATLAELQDDVDRQALAWLRPVLVVRDGVVLAEVAHEEADRYQPGMRRTV